MAKKGTWKEIVGVLIVLMVAVAIWQAYDGSPGAIASAFVDLIQGGADILLGAWNAITPD